MKRPLSDRDNAAVQPFKALTVNMELRDSLRFIIDSGASMTIVDNKNNIQNYSNCMRELQVADSSADALISEGNGVVQLNSAVKLKDVLFCPKVSANLLSVAQLADMGFDIIFTQHGCVVKHRVTGLIAMGEGNRYVYERAKAGEIYFTNQLKPPTRAELMHKRMGHINFHDLYNLQRMAEGITMEKNPADYDCVGSIAYMYIPEQKRRGAGHPLFDKAKPLTFVGYSKRFKGWMFFDMKTKKLDYSSEAIFFEDGLTLPQEPAIAKSLVTTFSSTIDQDEILELVEVQPVSLESDAELDAESEEPDTSNDVVEDNASIHSDHSEDSEDSNDPLTRVLLLLLKDDDFNESQLLTALYVHVNSDTPTFAEARNSSLSPKYKEAIAKEYKSL